MTDRDTSPDIEASARIAGAAGAVLSDGPGRSTLAVQRAAFLAAARRADAPRPPRLARWVWSSAAAVAAVTCVVALLLRPPVLATYGSDHLREHAVVRSRPDASGPLTLADGTALKLSADTELELTELSGTRASVTLRRGSVVANVRKIRGRVFSIFAGAYEVRVVGTTFDVAFQGSDLSVGVTEGKVLVLGGKLLGNGTLLGPGQRLDTRHLASALQLPGNTTSSEKVGSDTALQASSPPSETTPKVSWDQLSRSGRYREALSVAEQLGFERLTRTLGEGDLLVLANTARFAGDSTRARLALGRIRSRFPERPVATLAALYLARVAENQDHDPAAAVRWLRVYLAEAPNGDMAPGARASLIDVALKQGNQAEARKAAADYLEHHPQGPHASQARAVLASRGR
jgi:hypothetical protein